MRAMRTQVFGAMLVAFDLNLLTLDLGGVQLMRCCLAAAVAAE